tara:strand:- start:908 stop:2692 length:1785 start_codon:yes stop_codon:yes gene_type:complete
MEFSGKNNREVLLGSNGSFDLTFSTESLKGEARFGLSGDGDVPINFLFSSGIVYDTSGYQVYSYNSGQTVSISGNFSGDSSANKQYYNYYIADELFRTSGESQGFLIEKFFVNTTGCTAQVFLDLKSSTSPSYQISMPSDFRERTNFTGTLTNNTSLGNIKILSGQVTSPTGDFLDFIFTGHNYSTNTNATAASGGGTVNIEIFPSGGLFKNGPFGVDLDLYTNFGKISTGFVVDSLPEKEYAYFLSNSEDIEEIFVSGSSVFSGSNSLEPRTGEIDTSYYISKDGLIQTGSFLHQSLVYVSGYTGGLFTGENGSGIYSSGSGNLTGSGTIVGSGFIESGTTGVYDLSGEDVFAGTPNTSGLSITGNAESTGRFYWYATGDGSINYSITATGYSQLSGVGGLSGTSVLSTGTITGTINETGIGGSGEAYASNSGQEYGVRIFTGNITGAPDNTGSIDYPSSGLQSGSSLAHTGYFSGNVLASGTFQNITGSGSYSGYLTGYTKTFENTFNFKTGEEGSSTLADYSTSGFTSGTPIDTYASSGQINSIPYDINSQIIFTPSFDNEQMVVKYISSGVNTTGTLNNIKDELTITGQK